MNSTPATTGYSNPWATLDYALTIRELRSLQWLRMKVQAREHLGRDQEYVTNLEAARLAFAKHLARSQRISEFVGVEAG